MEGVESTIILDISIGSDFYTLSPQPAPWLFVKSISD